MTIKCNYASISYRMRPINSKCRSSARMRVAWFTVVLNNLSLEAVGLLLQLYSMSFMPAIIKVANTFTSYHIGCIIYVHDYQLYVLFNIATPID